MALCVCGALGACSGGGAQPVGHQGQLAVAEQMIQNGQYSEGYAILDEVAEREITSPKLRLDVADTYFNVDALLKSEDLYREAVQGGAFAAGTIGLGRVALARNEAAHARTYFTSVLAKEPNNIAALNGLGVSYDLDANHAQAQVHYRQVIALDRTNTDALNNYGLSLILDGSVQNAASILTDLTESNLDNPTSRQNLAIAYYVMGERDAAMRLAQIDASNDSSERLMAAVVSYRKGHL